jgi:hypothetical protein
MTYDLLPRKTEREKMRSVPLPEFGEVESEQLKPGHEVAGFKILQCGPIYNTSQSADIQVHF